MKNKTILFLVAIKIILAITIVSADVITPGFHGISIGNYIENIEDFPDYVFVSGGWIGTGMCPLKFIGEDGEIDSYYKFCSVFVYAIPKDNFNETKLQEMNTKDNMGGEEVKAYFDSIGGKEVIESVNTYSEVPVVSSLKGIKRYYEVSLNEVQESPTKTVRVRSNIVYLYFLVPIIALGIIVWIIIKKKRRK
jgi:hypothetical protein